MTKPTKKALGHRFTYIHVENLANIHRSLLYSHLFLAAALEGSLLEINEAYSVRTICE